MLPGLEIIPDESRVRPRSGGPGARPLLNQRPGGRCAYLLTITLAFALISCSAKIDRATSETVEQTYPIEPNASLSIRNGHGSIVIRGTDTPDLKLQAVKKTKGATQLSDIGIDVAAQPKSVSITTNFIRPKNKALSAGSGTVDYVLTVPATVKLARVDLDDGEVLIEGMQGEDIRANVVDGRLTLRRCCGNGHVTIANGALDFFYDQCQRAPFSVEAQITNGNARLFLPRRGSFHVRAETATGRVINDFDGVEVNGRSSRKAEVSLGRDLRSEMSIRATTGNIRIAQAEPAGPESAKGASVSVAP